jgi:threonine dehydrogenase-like Zn-dependent dehydrogenase
LRIKGTWNSRYPEDWQETIKAIESGKLQLNELITHKYNFSKLNEALEMIHCGKENRCKILINA